MTAQQSQRILLAEDDARAREISALVLQTEGYRVSMASNGTEALEMLLLDPEVDMLVSDINMPGGIDGIQLARRVQQSLAPLRIILLSAYPQDSFTDFPDNVAFLSKPYDRRALLNAVDTSFRTHKGGPIN
ncbi:MAG: response regulator [Lysobacterales bacterium]|jgi:CheY-like chemotaxis protein